MKKKEEWFKSWFDTPFYHILYKHRNDYEAQGFILNITSFLKLKKTDYLLDLGCGRGRHSIFLNSLGFKVLGKDLSQNSISYAKEFENDTLKFKIHDMRNPFSDKFNVVLNLFTSFGFFEDDNEDLAVLRNIRNSLLPNGIAIIDFMNSKKAIRDIKSNETQTIDNIVFNISRHIEGDFIIKKINFDSNNKTYQFYEKVKCLDFEKINYYLNSVGFKIKHTFGDYQLNSFDSNTSDRLILVIE